MTDASDAAAKGTPPARPGLLGVPDGVVGGLFLERTASLGGSSFLAAPLGLFWGLVVVLLVLHQGERMGILFPAISLAFGLWSARSRPTLYIAFTYLLFLLTPLVRRAADYGSSYHDPSTVLAAPLLVSVLCFVYLPRLLREKLAVSPQALIPFCLAALGIGYGVFVGILRSPLSELVRPTLEWIAPIVFGTYCALHAAEHRVLPLLRKMVVVSVLAVGLYGLVQFANPLPWDIFWLQNFNHTHFQPSFGQPQRFQIRLFATLNSPQTFASLLSFAFPMLVALRSPAVSAVAMPVCLLCLALTQSRSQFLSVAVACLLLIVLMPGKSLVRFSGLAAVLCLMFVGGAVSSDATNKITDRFDSLNNLKSDESAISRSLGIRAAIATIASEPFGQGVGFPDGVAFERSDLATRYGVDTHDLGILEVGLSLGYLGSVLFVAGFGYALFQVGREFLCAGRANVDLVVALFAGLATLATVNPFQGLPGVLLWATLGCLLAIRKEPVPLERSAPTMASALAVGAEGQPA